MIPTPAKKLKYTYKTEPWAHQKRALGKVLKLDGRTALFMGMGTGKTKVALDWVGIGYHNHEVRRVLVVAPLSVLGVWPRQIRTHLGAPASVFRLSGSTIQKCRDISRIVRTPRNDRVTFVLINYESLWRSPSRGKSIPDWFEKWNPDIIIFDESHRIKTPTSKQSRAAFRIARPTSQRLLLTGTPITKAPLDIFGQYRSLDHEIFGTNWGDFKDKYAIWGGTYKNKILRYKNLQELIIKVRKHSFRITKEQCLDLPSKLFVDIDVTLSDRAKALYREMAENSIVEIELEKEKRSVAAMAPIVLTKIMRLQQITSGFIKDTEGIIREFDDAKLKVCMDLVSDLLEEEHKVVIFCRFTHDISRLSVELHKKVGSRGFRILSGSVPERDRDSIVQEFQNDSEVRVFVAQIQTGSEGIELTASDVAIYYSMDNKLLYWLQSQDRLHRPGQTRNVTYYRLIAPRTVDVLTYQALDDKKKIADIVIHNPLVLRP